MTKNTRLHPGLVPAAWLVLLVGYLALFFSTVDHRDWLGYLLIPDDVARSWFGGERLTMTWSDRLPVLGLALVVMLTGGFLGRAALDALRVTVELTSLERCVFSLATGLSLLSTWTLLAGLAGQLRSPIVMAGPPVLGAAVGVFCWWRGRRILGEGPIRALESSAAEPTAAGPSSSVVGLSPFKRREWLPGLMIPFAAILLLGAMLPPWEFDVLEYHQQAPKEWWERGRIDFVPHNVYANMPLGAEMHSLWAMSMARGVEPWWWGALAGKTVIGLMTLVTAGGLLAAGRRWLSSAAGAAAGTVYLSMPWIMHVSMAGLIDAVVGMYFLLAAMALKIAAHGGHRRGMVVLAGFLAGSAAACKYPAVVFVIAPLTAAASLLGHDAWRRRLGTAALFLLAALAACGCWYGKNAALSGNPVYPLLYGAFGGETRTAERDEQWRLAHRPRRGDWRAYSPGEFAASVKQVLWNSEWAHPLLVPLILAAALARDHRRLVYWLSLVGFCLAAWWLLTHRIDRFWVPALPLAALAAGVGLEKLIGWFGVRTVTLALIPILFLLLLVNSVPGKLGNPFANNRFFLPLPLLREMSTPPAHLALNAELGDGACVLLVGEARPFYLTVRCRYSTCFDEPLLERVLRASSREERREIFRSAGVTHVQIDWNEIERYRSPGNYGFAPVITRQAIERQLVQDDRLLRRLPFDSRLGELFAVSPE